MKRFALSLLTLFAVFATAIPPELYGGSWVTKEVRWRISSVGSPTDPTAIYVRDTLRTSIGPVDTTSVFTLNDADVPPRGLLAPGVVGQAAANVTVNSVNDTTIIAYLVLAPDTSGTPPTPAFTSVTALIDGRLAGLGTAPVTNGVGWVKADSALANGAVGGGMILGDQTISFPIRTMSPYGGIFKYNELRARITGVGGATGLAAARVFLRYWDEESK